MSGYGYTPGGYAPHAMRAADVAAALGFMPSIPTKAPKFDSVGVNATGWLEALVPASEVAGKNALISLSPTGEAAGVFASRSSGNNVPDAQSGWAIGAFSFNDNTVAVKDTYGVYGENHRWPSTGNTAGIEWSTNNRGPVTTRSPFDILSGGDAVTLLLDAGRSDTIGGTDATAAIVVQGSGGAIDMRYRTGMMWTANSLRDNPAFGGPVVHDFPGTFRQIWRARLDGSKAALKIGSDAINTYGWGMLATDGGMLFMGPSGSTPLSYTASKVITTSLDVSGTFHALGTLAVDAGIIGHVDVFGDMTFAQRAVFQQGIILGVLTYADDNAAKAAGLPLNAVYRTPNGNLTTRVTP